MVKVVLDELRKISDTFEASSSLDTTLELIPEGFTLIFPWGSSLLSHKRSLSYLRYCMDLPTAASQRKILQLLGLKPYRRSWWTQNYYRKELYLRQIHRHQRPRVRAKPTGTGSTIDT